MRFRRCNLRIGFRTLMFQRAVEPRNENSITPVGFRTLMFQRAVELSPEELANGICFRTLMFQRAVELRDVDLSRANLFQNPHVSEGCRAEKAVYDEIGSVSEPSCFRGL